MKLSSFVAMCENAVVKGAVAVSNSSKRVANNVRCELEAQRIADGQMAQLRAEREVIEGAEIAARAEELIAKRVESECDKAEKAIRKAVAKAVLRGDVKLVQLRPANVDTTQPS